MNHTVIYEDNGIDVFEGTLEECKTYIEQVQVAQYGNKAQDFGIYDKNGMLVF
ncbi:MAG: hypothetical protein NC489_26130 [Ruminococcus flavefaciens]|nr:hypothetical protein [Ruminococcus flavefaciens]